MRIALICDTKGFQNLPPNLAKLALSSEFFVLCTSFLKISFWASTPLRTLLRSRVVVRPLWRAPFRSPNPYFKNPNLLNDESMLLFVGDRSFGVFPLFLLSAIAAFGDPECYLSLAIIARGAFDFIVTKKTTIAQKNGQEESRLLSLRRLGCSRYWHSKYLIESRKSTQKIHPK